MSPLNRRRSLGAATVVGSAALLGFPETWAAGTFMMGCVAGVVNLTAMDDVPRGFQRTALKLAVLGTLLATSLLARPAGAADRAPPELTSQLAVFQKGCDRGDARACRLAAEVAGQLSSRGWCYGRPGDTLAWERSKTGWVRCR